MSEKLTKEILEVWGPLLKFTLVLGLCAFVFVVVRTGILDTVPNGSQAVDYANLVVILLTTVTVLFSIAALALGVAGFYGFKSIKKNAEEAAERAISNKIDRAFKDGGDALIQIREEVTDDKRPLGDWLRKQVEREVTKQVGYRVPIEPVDEDDPADEGEQN